MNNPSKYVLIGLGVFVVLIIVLRFAGMLNIYSQVTTAKQCTVAMGQNSQVSASCAYVSDLIHEGNGNSESGISITLADSLEPQIISNYINFNIKTNPAFVACLDADCSRFVAKPNMGMEAAIQNVGGSCTDTTSYPEYANVPFCSVPTGNTLTIMSGGLALTDESGCRSFPPACGVSNCVNCFADKFDRYCTPCGATYQTSYTWQKASSTVTCSNPQNKQTHICSISTGTIVSQVASLQSSGKCSINSNYGVLSGTIVGFASAGTECALHLPASIPQCNQPYDTACVILTTPLIYDWSTQYIPPTETPVTPPTNPPTNETPTVPPTVQPAGILQSIRGFLAVAAQFVITNWIIMLIAVGLGAYALYMLFWKK